MMDIREASPGDYLKLVLLTESEGWNYREEDFAVLSQAGFVTTLVATTDREIIGMISLLDYGDVGWISNVLVEKAYRGRRIGSDLIREGLKQLGLKRTVALFSNKDAVRFYIREGFKLEGIYSLVTFMGRQSTVGRSREIGIDAISLMDQQAFSMRRRSLLETLAKRGKIVSPTSSNGFAIVRPDPVEPTVGPVVCDNSSEGRELLFTTLGMLGTGAKAVMVGEAMEGLHVEQKVNRLYVGERPHMDKDKAIAFAGLEFG